MSAPDFELPAIEMPFPVASMDPRPSGDPVASDGGFILYPQAGADEEPRFVSAQEIQQAMDELKGEIAGIINAGLNFVPVFGQIKGVIEAFVGRDLTGHKLSGFERILNLASVIPHVHGAEGFLKVMGEIGHVSHTVNKGVHGGHGVVHGNNALDMVTGRTHD